LFCRHSKLTPKVLLNIDGEDILPDGDSMSTLQDNVWKPGDPIPGSCRWRAMLCQKFGADTFFDMIVGSENPMFAFLRKTHTLTDLKTLVVDSACVDRALAARPYFEQLIRSFEVAQLEDLQKGVADFQQVLDRWAAVRARGAAITLFSVATGKYD